MPARKEKSTLLVIPGNERGRERYVEWMVVRGSTVDRTRGGQEKREWGRIYSGILLLCKPIGNVPTLGLAFEFSAIRER